MLNIMNTINDLAQIYTIKNLILDIQGMVNYLDVKDLYYFRNLTRIYQLSTIKQILPLIIQKQTQPVLNHTKFIYIPAKSIRYCEIGHPISSNIKQLSQVFQITIYKVSKHVDYILQKLYFKDNPLLKRCKAYQKLQFYLNCNIQSYYFNQKVFIPNDNVQSIYYVLSGQLKLEKFENKNSNKETNKISHVTKKLLEVGSYAGFQQYIDCIPKRKSSLISNSNSTKVLVIKTDVLNRYLEIKFSKIPKQEGSQQISLAPSQQNKQLYKQFFSPYLFYLQKVNFSFERQQQKPTVQYFCENNKDNNRNLSSIKFLKKINNYVKENNYSTSNLSIKKLIQSKSLILRLKQSTQMSKKKFNQKQKENIFVIRKMLQGPKIKFTKRYGREQFRLNQSKNYQQEEGNLSGSRNKAIKRQDILTAKLRRKCLKSQRQNKFHF